MHRQHVTTVLGKAEQHTPPAAPRRRATDRLAAPRALVYVEDYIELIAEGPDGVLLTADRARELAVALLGAADVLEAGGADELPPLDYSRVLAAVGITVRA